MNFYLCQHTFIYTLLTVVDLHIKWHNDSQDDLFKDHFSPFLIFLCLYFLSWRSFSVRAVCIFVKRDLIFPEKLDSCSCCSPLPANNLTTLMFAKGSVCVSHCIVHLIMWTSVTRGIRPPLSEHHCCLSGFTVLQFSHSS